MDDEFKLCWKNFQDNIASGFQSLYDRGDLVDVTLACDGKLLQAHKIVLAICSPYFQEIFVTNPCKHPIIILKDVSYTIMCELLEFMYQGVVNVKHTELQAFMKIGQLLQIKGLATNNSSPPAGPSLSEKSNSNHNTTEEKEPSQVSRSTPKSAASPNHNDSTTSNTEKPSQTTPAPTTSSNTPQRVQSPDISMSSPASPSLNISSVTQKQVENNLHHNFHLTTAGNSGLKRHLSDYNSDSLSIYSRNKNRRTTMPTDQSSDNNEGSDVGGGSSMDQMNAEDFFMPHMSMVEGRYDLNSVKRDSSEHHLNANSPSAAAAAAAAASLRNSFNPAAFGLDYSFYKNSNSGSASTIAQEFPNELNISSGDYSKGFANHMDIPPNCPNVVMLSSTSLLHGNCVFNRNNTVATQQGMKTYWLCKSYRISMCRARCITHQGKIISATGVHNHTPHMRGNNAGGAGGPPMNDVNMGPTNSNNMSGGSGPSGRFAQNIPGPSANIFPTNYHGSHHGHPMSPSTPPPMQHTTFTANEANAIAPTSSHHFVQMTPNLGQHQLSSLHPPAPHPQSSNNNSTTIMHPQPHGSYDITSPSSGEHSRNANPQVYDTSSKSQKGFLNDDHISVQNAAELSPSHHMKEEGDRQQNDKSSTDHHHPQQQQQQPQPHHKQQHEPVQVIDSITISPGGNGHNFKMEPL
ncbi:broad-complex core protein isoforms 1/2/3/4/5 isoform X1 [Musca domestica]|uniref:Broad-complex core protein isoforms 1/2/3/4/5 isoform X1 n=1 Tax=Musca domestica TaxID=7370 RepID=A0A9J7CTH1_MUSDO|nr:broad-complex core protein isoforms 1/2/3/4/5 isoform X1 [Musca domestica]